MTTVSPPPPLPLPLPLPLALRSWQGRRILALLCAVAYLPLTFGVGIAAGIGAKLVTKVGSRAVICTGALIAATGLFLLGHVPAGGGYPAHILPGLLLVAFGVGPVFVGVTTAANAGVEPSRAGLAAAILNSCQQLGGALDLAIFSAVGTAQVHHLLARGIPAPDATTSGIRHALGDRRCLRRRCSAHRTGDHKHP